MPAATLRKPTWYDWADVLRPPEKLPIDEWAERSVVLPRGMSSEPGPLDLNRTPYLREVLRTFQDPQVEEVTLCWSTQIGKTLAAILAACWVIDQTPGPILHVMAREHDALAINLERYQPIIRESPALARHMTGSFTREFTKEAIHLHGASLCFAGAGSPAALASRAIYLLTLDEVDKYPPYSGREADPVALARERTRTYLEHKILKTSSPTTDRGYIWREYLDGDRRRYLVPCPHCGAYQRLVLGTRERGLGGIKWPPEERNPERIVDYRLAWYECEGCHQEIRDAQRSWMFRRGVWVPEGCILRVLGVTAGKETPEVAIEGTIPPRRRLSYHLSALYSPWLTWSHIAAEFLRSERYQARLMNFRNSWLAEVWEDVVEELKDTQLKERRGPYVMGEVPAGGRLLTAGIDVQLDHLWYVIRAWGDLGESWLVKCGRVEGWEALSLLLFRSHYTVRNTKTPVPVLSVFVDCGYAERRSEVYEYCRTMHCQPVRGRADAHDILKTSIRYHAGGSIREAQLDVNHYRGRLHRLIQTRSGDPGEWHLPEDTPEEYYQHMTAEQRVLETDKKTGQTGYRWKKVIQGAPNHLWDCEVYALAAAHAWGIEHAVYSTQAGENTETKGARSEQADPSRKFKRLAVRLFS